MRARGKAVVVTLAVGVALGASGCEWNGLNSVPMPGTQGRGEGSYEVQIEMPNVTTLSQNSPVRVDDVAVGSVSNIEVQGWHALVTVSLNPEVELPANATAKIGQTSLLGSQHIELAPPVEEAPEGRLEAGDVIPLERAGAYPTTEQTLSSLSVVLNGGGLAQVQDITTELNAALIGREDAVRDLLPQLDQLVGSLDKQRGDIISAMEGIDRLSYTVEAQRDTLNKALDGIPPALDILVAQRQDITNALTSLGGLSEVASRVINESGEDFATNVRSLSPTLKALADSGNALTQVLGVLLTFPFPQNGIDNVIRGDYANLAMTIDLTLPRLDANFLTGTPLAGSLGGPEGVLGTQAGLGGQAGNPLSDPLRPAAVPAPAAPAPAAEAPAADPNTITIPGLPPITIPGLPQGAPAP
ncbi:MCE family protein [Rhodococcus sp. MS16]|uniref:MCE family protein n=1 Tax=unclassified Rhodococcus (in: high G+C Gram-positive bacteria) TaxID=192944 RepID=UPI000E274AD3|nr:MULTISPECIES: MCE family protein [unclassified Rhodococcus (in: high G+C Gram-positive bacteria)]NRI65340.1 MCE family protein [Rhodococcus sp. MS16]RZL24752.1 MAG: MCE family protein [Rhodococcus sp. (in: high G+C Gram-positive bacteria)]